MTDVTTKTWTASDGVELAYHELGEGRPVILIHGLFSNAQTNWIKFGHAQRIARDGFRVIMPDLRAHGASGKPHDPACYPCGILARDIRELAAQLGLEDFDLGGFSLGARTTIEAVGEGLRPGKAVLGGMGLEGLKGWLKRKDFFIDAIDRFNSSSRGDPHWLAIQFMKTMNVDLVAARLLLQAFAPAKDEWFDAFTMPTLVICGSEDQDNGSGRKLAEVLPNAAFEEVPGTHMSSVTQAAFGEAIARFLSTQ
jgi:pimeloyl-ACP methyl ester carboxylesterase